MLFAVEYEDGDIVTSSERTWAQLYRDKNIDSLIVYDTDEQQHVLTDFDVWFFSDVAVVNSGTAKFEWESRMTGGCHFDSGEGTLICVYPKGGYTETPIKLEELKAKFSESAFIYNDSAR